MPVIVGERSIRLVGGCEAADAEPLTAALSADPRRPVDLTEAGALHTAVVQALLAFRPPVAGPAGDPFVERWIVPLLADS